MVKKKEKNVLNWTHINTWLLEDKSVWIGTVAVGMFGYVDFIYFWLIIAQLNNVKLSWADCFDDTSFYWLHM